MIGPNIYKKIEYKNRIFIEFIVPKCDFPKIKNFIRSINLIFKYLCL